MNIKLKSLFALFLAVALQACMSKSPEGLPKFKERFQEQIDVFEKHKEKADKLVNKGLKSLSALEEALQDARNEDKEFNRVYGHWQSVDAKVKKLNREYEQLRKRAEDLFSAIEKQVNGLNNEDNKRQLLAALKKSRQNYEATLANTAKAIKRLRKLHNQAVDIVKALEAAVAIGQVSDINEGLINIETQVDDVMKELDVTISESKKLYDQKIGDLQ